MSAEGQPDDRGPRSKNAEEALRRFHSTRESGCSDAEARARLDREGANEVPEKPGHPVLRLAGKLWGLSAWMLELIALLSWVLHKRADFWIALALLCVNALLSFFQEQRASTAVEALRMRLQVNARVLRDAAWKLIPARDLVRGDVLRVRAGDFIPADALVLDGEVRVDQSALTGESQDLHKGANETLYSGSVVRRGEATAVVVATGVRTFFGRTAQLVESAHPRLQVEIITARLVSWLFAIVGGLVGLTLVLSAIRGLPLLDVLPLSLVLLMSAVPVALPVMFTVSTAIGSMELGRRGVLITRLAAVEDAANMDVLCADKTGTLTMNRLALARIEPQSGFTADEVVRAAALASNEADQDPIDMAFLRAARERRLVDGDAKTIAFTPFSPESRRTEAVIERGGRSTRAIKGALRTVGEMVRLDAQTLSSLEARAGEAAQQGARVLAVAEGELDQPPRLVGLAFLRDAPRPDSRQLIEELRSLGIRVDMLTGDGLPVARALARELDLGEIVRAPDLRTAERTRGGAAELAMRAEGFAEVFPEDKFLVVQSLQAAGHVVGMTGDGVNDAPALRQAEVGIAVSSSTDVAKGAASVVLTAEGLSSIVHLVRIGRSIYQRVLTWIVNKVSRTILKAGFVVGAFLATGRFVISALGMVLLVFMTDFVKIALSADRVRPSPRPESWRIGPLVKVAVVLGILMLGEALALLAVAWHRFDLRDGRLDTFSFLTLLFFALFSIVSIRERRAFWRSRPGWILVAALVGDALIGAAIGSFGLAELHPVPFAQTAVIIVYALVCSLGVNDLLKTYLVDRLWTRAATKDRRATVQTP